MLEYPSHLGFCIERVWVQLFCSGQLLHNPKKGRKYFFCTSRDCKDSTEERFCCLMP